MLFILEQQATDLAFSDVFLSADAGTELFQAEVRRAPGEWRRFGGYMLQSFRTTAGPLAAPPPSALLSEQAAEN